MNTDRDEYVRRKTTEEDSNKRRRLEEALAVVSLVKDREMRDDPLYKEQVRPYTCGAIVPVLSAGLLRLVEILPEDPVDYLVAPPYPGRIYV
jgi:hypothetical protein